MVGRFGSVRKPSMVLAGVLWAVVAACALASHPRPAPVPYRWELDFEPGELRLYVDNATGESFWWFTYMVTNRTGEDQLWAPSLVLFTDRGEIIQAGRDVPRNVTDELLDLVGNELIEDQNDIIGDILQGKENAKEGLVVWRAAQTSVNELSLFIAGISGETARVKNPMTNAEVILRKTLQRDYLIPGDAIARGNQPVELVSQTWILR